jgi:hypothetical protein
MAAIYSNGSNRWNILGFNFTKRDALSSVYKISMKNTRRTSTFQAKALHWEVSSELTYRQKAFARNIKVLTKGLRSKH